MTDREKFDYAAYCFGNDARHDCRQCDYYIRTNCVEYCDERRIVRDALDLLKEKKPVEPEMEGGGSTWWMVCGECHGQIDEKDDYCRHCGRRIKHEEKAK